MISRSVTVSLLAVSALSSITVGAATASTEKLLYSFPASSGPIGRPDQDGKGTLYGTFWFHHGAGGIFRLKQNNGVWTYQTLFGFDGGSDGDVPWAGPLIDRSTGILYGTTEYGGNFGDGTVYSLAFVGGSWSETVLHSFSGSDGAHPLGVLMKDKRTGNLYGTTYDHANDNCGTAFQLSQSNGSWTFNTIYNFQDGSDACAPRTQLIPGAKAGTLIGATRGPPIGFGEVFQLKERRGVWSHSVVHTFTGGSDGEYPQDLAASGDGTIYGIAEGGKGVGGGGVVFKLTPNLNKYTFSVIYHLSDGGNPAGINFDAATGNLYGTTTQGGAAGEGTVFRLSPTGDAWTETVLHNFTGAPGDGAYPFSRPIIDGTTGALYGTTKNGGADDGGTVYEVQP
jgi:uncharacterized repeat protein (TIGR03803 family)